MTRIPIGVSMLNRFVMVGFWPSSRSRHVCHCLETSLLCQWAQLTYRPNLGPKRKNPASPWVYIWLDITYRIHYLIGVVQLSENSNNLYRDPFRSYPKLRCEDPLKPTTPALFIAGSMILAIHGFSYAVTSFSRSKRYNASTSMRTVINSGGSLCMTIPTIKQRDLSSYKKIIICKSFSYVDPKYSHLQWQLRRV